MVLLANPGAALAAGFAHHEQDAEAAALAGAWVARAHGLSSLALNPAGLAGFDGAGLRIAFHLTAARAEFSGVNPSPGFAVEERSETPTLPPLSAFAGARLSPAVAAGLALTTPYALETEWEGPDDFTGRFLVTRARLVAYDLAPVVAVHLSDAWRVGAGLDVVLSDFELERHRAAYDPFAGVTRDVGRLMLAGMRESGIGFHAGAQVEASPRWRLGVAYRSRVTIEHALDADFEQVPTGNAAFDSAVAASFPDDQPTRLEVSYPARLSSGIAYRVAPGWEIEADVDYTWWNAFDGLRFEMERDPDESFTLEQDWRARFAWRLGIERGRVSGGRASGGRWAWRAGYAFEPTPQPTESLGPLVADAARHVLAAGAGWSGDRIALDAYVRYAASPDRSTERRNRDGFDGTYSPARVSGGVSLTWPFREHRP